MKREHIEDRGLSGKYFHIMLNIADDELDVYQYRLLGHYRRVCGDNSDGACWEGTRTTAARCKMSIGKVSKTRRELERLGYIKIESRPDDTLRITLVDRMADNVARYFLRLSSEQGVHVVNDGVHVVNDGVHVVNDGVHVVNDGVHVVNERITNEEKPTKKKPTADSAAELSVVVGGNLPPEKPKAKRTPKMTPEQEFRGRWQKNSAVGCALLAAFGADFVEPERQPRAALERYLAAAEQLQAAGCSPDDVPDLYRYIKRRAHRDEWPGSFGPAALARYYPDYLKSKQLAAANDIVDDTPIVPILLTREPIVAIGRAS